MVGVAMVFIVSSAMAKEIILFDNPLNLLGYATQGAILGLHNSYDTEAGLQSALMNLFLEGDYKIADRLKFYGASLLTVDWAYQLNSGRDSWEDKGFPKSHDRLNVDNKDWQLLKEAHLTWTPGDFMFRVRETDCCLGGDRWVPADGPDQPLRPAPWVCGCGV